MTLGSFEINGPIL